MSVRTDVVNLNVNVNGDKGKKELNDLRKVAADLTVQMKGLKKGTDEYNAASKQLSQVEDRMAAIRKEIGLTALSQKELTKELQRLNLIKSNLTPGTEEFKNMQKQIDATKARLTEVRTGLSGFKKMWSDIGAEVKGFGILAASYLGFEFISSGLKHIITGAGRTSDALAQLQIYMHGSAKDAQDLYQALRQIDTRTSNKDLLDIASIVAKKGVVKEQIVGVTKALDQLFVVLGKEIGDPHEAVASLVKLVNVYSDDHHVTAQNIQNIGSAIQGLTSSGVATGAFLISFAERLAGVRGITGITIQSVLGLGAALEELGQRNESAATAAQKLIIQMFLKPADYAKSAGLSIKKFSDLLSKDPVEALIKVAATLKQTGKAPEDLITAFGEMGVNGARVIGVLGDIAGNADYMRKRTQEAYKFFGNAGAITDAFALKNENLGAVLDKIGKKISSSFTSSALVNWLKDVAVGFGKLIGAVEDTNKEFDVFQKQKTYVEQLQRDINPLIETYERLGAKALELKGVTKLSTDEQALLKEAIEGIAKAIPGAITQFDNYGNAIGISTDRARAFLELQKKVLKEEHRDAINSAEDEISKIQSQIETVQRGLNDAQEKRNNVGKGRPGSDSFGEGLLADKLRLMDVQQQTDKWDKQITKLQVNLAKLQDRLAGQHGLVAKLGGDPLPLPETANGPSGMLGAFAFMASNNNTEAGAVQENTDRTIAAIKADLKRVNKELLTASAEKRATLIAEQKKLKEELAHAQGKATPDEKKAKRDADRKAKAAAKAMETGAEKLKRFQQQLEKGQADIDAAFQSDDDKRIQAVVDKYQKILQAVDRELHGKKGNLLVKMSDYAALVAGFDNQQIEELNLILRKSAEDRGKKEVEAFQDAITRQRDETETANANGINGAENAVSLAPKGSNAELEAQKALLRAKFRAEVDNRILTNKELFDLEKKRDKETRKLDRDSIVAKVQMATEMLQGLSNVFSGFVDLQNQKDDQQLSNEKAANDQKKASYSEQLKKKLISQKQYDDAIAGLDTDMDKRQKEIAAKQLKRNKSAALFSAFINAAMGITKIWAEYADVPWVAAALTAIEVAATGVQIAKIEQQQVPKGRKGLVVSGSSHENGGIDMIDRGTGRAVANIEGGEPVMVLSKNTYGNNKGVIDQLIYNSQYRNGAAVAASSWYGSAGPRVNAGRVIPLMRNGGVAGASSVSGGGLGELGGLLQQLITEQQHTQTVIREQNTKLQAVVVLQDLKDKQTLLDKAKSVAGVNQKAA